MEAVVLFLGLFYLVIWTDSVESERYKIETLTCELNYGHVIATEQTDSVAHCSIKCESWIGCRSSVYNNSTGTCALNNKTKISYNTVQGECGKKLKYIEKEYSNTQAVFRSCQSDLDCSCEDTNQQCPDNCLNGKNGKECKCHIYENFNIFDKTCRDDCSNFDDTFVLVDRSNVDYSKSAIHTNVTLTECKEKCLNETTSTCISFTYREETSECTHLDDSKHYIYIDDDTVEYPDIYTRVCADP